MINSLVSLEGTNFADALTGSKVGRLEQVVQRGELVQASQEFEAYFLSYLLKVMRATVPKGELTANKVGEKFYAFYDEEIGKRAAEVGGIGLSAYVLDAVARNEGLPSSPANLSSSLKS